MLEVLNTTDSVRACLRKWLVIQTSNDLMTLTNLDFRAYLEHSSKKQQCHQLFKTLPCKLPTPQVEKVCGPLGAGPMMTRANHVSNHTNLHITTSVTPPTSATSERSSVTSPPSVVPADQHLQLQSQRWVTNVWQVRVRQRDQIYSIIVFLCVH